MPTYDYDLFTIGAGSGGVAGSRRAGSYGARVAICEDSRVGGTCVIRGCVPKKLLVYGSQYAGDFSDARGFGWTVPTATHDWSALIAAKDAEVDRLNKVYIRLLNDAKVELIEGRGVVVDPHTVEVNGKRYTSKYILVATGGHAVRPEINGAQLVITSNEALDLPALPRRLIIVGGGYIGVEFAGIFRSLGVEVTLMIRGDTVLRGFDDDVRVALTDEMRKRGIKILRETFVDGIAREQDHLSVTTRMGETFDVDAVMYAIGRLPNTRGLGLAEAGVELDAAGAVVVDAHSRSTRVESVYAIGDCTDRINLTPVAIAEGRAVASTLFQDRPMAISHENIPSSVFSQPPVATVGLTERTARADGREVDVYVSNFKAMKHTLSKRDERTLMKLVVDRATQRVLGVHMVGADAAEIIQGFAVALTCGATKAQFDATLGIHPSAAEEFVTMRDRRPDKAPNV